MRNAQEHSHALLSPPYPCHLQVCIGGKSYFPPSMASFLPRFYAIMAHFYAFGVILRVLRGSRRSVRSFGTFRWSMAGWWCRIRVAAAADGCIPFRYRASMGRTSAAARAGYRVYFIGKFECRGSCEAFLVVPSIAPTSQHYKRLVQRSKCIQKYTGCSAPA